jgi:hypothetical protein
MIEIKQVTDNSFDDGQPVISEKGDLGWEQKTTDPASDPIYYYEYQPGYEAPAPNVVGEVTYQESYPDLYYQPEEASSLVYEQEGDIYYWNSISGPENLTTGSEVKEGKPKIYGDYVAYEYGEVGDRDVYLYNLLDSSLTNLTSNPGDYYNIDLHNGYVVYEQDNATSKNIYGYDIAANTTTPISVDAKNATNAKVWKTEDSVKVAYEYETAPGDKNIYYYDSLTGATLSLGSVGNDDLNPYVAGNYIVWESYDGNDYEIYRYDTVTKTPTQITDNEYDDIGAKVSVDGNVIYQSVSQTTTGYHDINFYDGEATLLGSGPATAETPLDYEIKNDKATWEAWDGTDWEIYAGEYTEEIV